MAKEIVEDCEALRIESLFQPRPRKDRRAQQSRAGLSEDVMRTLRLGEDGELLLPDGTPALRVLYCPPTGDRQEIRVVGEPCRYGGVRVRFVCPVCKRRCGALHLRRGSFTCRSCHGLLYERQVWCTPAWRQLSVVKEMARRPNLLVPLGDELRRLYERGCPRTTPLEVQRRVVLVVASEALRDALSPEYRVHGVPSSELSELAGAVPRGNERNDADANAYPAVKRFEAWTLARIASRDALRNPDGETSLRAATLILRRTGGRLPLDVPADISWYAPLETKSRRRTMVRRRTPRRPTA